MAETTNKMFLDKTGLATLWGIITAKFATKSETITNVGVTNAADKATLTFTYADNTAEKPHTHDVEINAVNETNAGLMTPAMLTKLNTAADGTIANLELKYVPATENTADGDLKGKPVIQLWDGTESVLTQIDATEFVKDGMLSSADLVVNPEGMADGTYLKLVWNTDAGDKNETLEGVQDAMYINVTDLIDVYTAGDGIAINGKEISCTYKYELPTAAEDTLGGIKTGYTEVENVKNYAVKVDGNGNAYVAVPWEDTKYSATVQDSNLVKLELADTAFSINETALTTRLNGIDTAVSSKIASVTGEDGDNALISITTDANKAVTVASTTKLSNAVEKAENSIQGVGVLDADKNIISVEKDDDNNITLSAGTDLEAAITNANSAVQTVKIGDLEFTKADGVASVAHDDFVGYFAMTDDDIKAICV